ncbi:hypothetical protein SAMN05216588_10673 [Pseudomonas flavescens]|uniref:Uncharacterized protein n=1 Tax=Phytopseudomonas flavescens TaxID=29435 RepID=A0A1G8E5G8_9GAMM|nr:hypothetical protein [Pseudomonas flavescens]SDH64889.1 hypothetical protein SAMN05216588_10673 [Pseudomonas flavescens]
MSTADQHDDETFTEQALLEAIENQLQSGEPAFARAVLNTLTLVGYERAESVQMMAMVLAHEVDAMLREDRPFDSEGYEQALRALPTLPEEH